MVKWSYVELYALYLSVGVLYGVIAKYKDLFREGCQNRTVIDVSKK